MHKETLDNFEKAFTKLIWSYEDFVGREYDQDYVNECNEIKNTACEEFKKLKNL
jgi:hypothetical protein